MYQHDVCVYVVLDHALEHADNCFFLYLSVFLLFNCHSRESDRVRALETLFFPPFTLNRAYKWLCLILTDQDKPSNTHEAPTVPQNRRLQRFASAPVVQTVQREPIRMPRTQPRSSPASSNVSERSGYFIFPKECSISNGMLMEELKNYKRKGRPIDYEFSFHHLAVEWQDSLSQKWLSWNSTSDTLELVKGRSKSTQFYIVRTETEGVVGLMCLKPSRSSWGFVGQTFLHKLTVSAKKLQLWEEFKLLRHSVNDEFSFYLHATRFGKGLWLGSSSHHTDTGGLSLEKQSTAAVRFKHYIKSSMPTAVVVPKAVKTPQQQQQELQLPWTLRDGLFLQSDADEFSLLVQDTDVTIDFDHFLQENFIAAWHDEAGNTLGAVGEWQIHPHVVGKVRKVSFQVDITNVPGYSSTRVDEYHCYQYNLDRSALKYQTKTFSHDVPYGKHFTIETLYRLTKTSVHIESAVYFSKSTMFKRQITDGALDGTKKTCLQMLNILKSNRSSRSSSMNPVSEILHSIQQDLVDGGATSPPIDLPWTSQTFLESKSFEKIHSDTLPCSLDEYFQRFMSDTSAFFTMHHDAKGNWDVDLGPWTPDVRFGHVRKQIFKTELEKCPGVSSTAVEEYQAYVRETDRRIVYEMKTFTLDVPYATYFSIEKKYTIEAMDESNCRIDVELNVLFSKSTVFKSRIESNTKKAVRVVTKELHELAQQHLVNEETIVSPTTRSSFLLVKYLEDQEEVIQSD